MKRIHAKLSLALFIIILPSFSWSNEVVRNRSSFFYPGDPSDRQIEFEIAGAGKLAAVASANPISTESFQLPRRKTWRGQCLLIVQSKKEKGDITITAHTEGLPNNKIKLRTE